ncbi:MAG: hypothetical protein EA350_16660 [Gemmatimonadales bacterium]|nr:MAG: hypothetical protein EA350_16660 [Gemmatimonadales bacterium]
MLRATRRILVVALLLGAWMDVAEAQSGGTLGSVLAGVQGTDPEPHLFAGVGGGYLVNARLGGEGVALLGGGGYRSILVGGGPSAVVLDAPRAQVRLWGGPAWYRESLAPSDAAAESSRAVRGTGAVMAGLTARAPMGRVALTGGLLFWTGRFEETGFERSEAVHGFRVTLGVSR